MTFSTDGKVTREPQDKAGAKGEGTWKLSKDPQFIAKVRDVVGLYLNPPERAVVLCVDEKSQIQALDRSATILPMLPGAPEREDGVLPGMHAPDPVP